jgi:hypothetical protein
MLLLFVFDIPSMSSIAGVPSAGNTPAFANTCCCRLSVQVNIVLKGGYKTILQSNNMVALRVVYLHLRYGMEQYTRRHLRRPLGEIGT